MGFSFPPPLPTTPSSVKGVSLPLKGSRTVKKKNKKCRMLSRYGLQVWIGKGQRSH